MSSEAICNAALIASAAAGVFFIIRAIARLRQRGTRAGALAILLFGLFAAPVAWFFGTMLRASNLPAAVQNWLWPLASVGFIGLFVFALERAGEVRTAAPDSVQDRNSVARGVLRAFSIICALAAVPGVILLVIGINIALETRSGFSGGMLAYGLAWVAIPGVLAVVLWKMAGALAK